MTKTEQAVSVRPEPHAHPRQGHLRDHGRHRRRLCDLGLRWPGQPRRHLHNRPELGHGVHRLALYGPGLALRRLRPVAGPRQVRQHPAGQGRREARIPHRLLGRDDVRRRHGHRTDVLRRGRTALPLHLSPARNRGRPHPRSHPDRHGHLDLPLDPAPLGNVRRGRHRHGLRHLPPRPQAADLRRLHLTVRHQDGGRAGRASSSTSWPSSPPSSAPPLPWASAPCRSAAA